MSFPPPQQSDYADPNLRPWARVPRFGETVQPFERPSGTLPDDLRAFATRDVSGPLAASYLQHRKDLTRMSRDARDLRAVRPFMEHQAYLMSSGGVFNMVKSDSPNTVFQNVNGPILVKLAGPTIHGLFCLLDTPLPSLGLITPIYIDFSNFFIKQATPGGEIGMHLDIFVFQDSNIWNPTTLTYNNRPFEPSGQQFGLSFSSGPQTPDGATVELTTSGDAFGAIGNRLSIGASPVNPVDSLSVKYIVGFAVIPQTPTGNNIIEEGMVNSVRQFTVYSTVLEK